MVPVRVSGLNWVTHGLALVPSVNPPQSNRSCVAFCSEVQLRQVTGAASVSG